MTFSQLLADSAPGQDTVLTIGVFDGVHLGHQHLLQHLIQRAQPNCQPGVITFSNHPATVLRPDHPVSHITSLEKKLKLIRNEGIDLVISLEFTQDLSQIPADDFADIAPYHLVGGVFLAADEVQIVGRQTQMGQPLAHSPGNAADYDFSHR